MAGETLSSNNQAINRTPWDELSTFDKMADQALARAITESQNVNALNQKLEQEQQAAKDVAERQDLEQAILDEEKREQQIRDAKARHDEAMEYFEDTTESVAQQESESEEDEIERLRDEAMARHNDAMSYLDESEENAKGEAAQRAREEGEQREREEGELRDVEESLSKNLADEAAIDAELAALDDETFIPIAINANFTHDRHELAQQLAENRLNNELNEHEKHGLAGAIQKLWKGSIFKRVYERRYTRGYESGNLKETIDGEELTIDAIINNRADGAIKRFMLGLTEDEEYIHAAAGENKNIDEQATEQVRNTILNFFKDNEERVLKMDNATLANELQQLFASAAHNNKTNQLFINNYAEIAMNAWGSTQHYEGLAQVMEGFKVYNAEVRDEVRTEAHRDNIDKALDWLESKHLGGLGHIPVDILAGAAGIAQSFVNTGARALGGVGAGLAISSLGAGIREYARVSEDRAKILRDAANGIEYNGTSLTEEEINNLKDLREKAHARYEFQLAGTLYKLSRANDLTASLDAAKSLPEGPERDDALMQAIVSARAHISISDRTHRDLISYTSADQRGNERLALDAALIEAKNLLSAEKQAELKSMQDSLEAQILNGDKNSQDESERLGVTQRDAAFRKLRRNKAIGKGVTTLAIGAATYLGTQEALSLIDPRKIGVFEKLTGQTLVKNNVNADETILASIGGRGTYQTEVLKEGMEYETKTQTIRADNTRAIQQYTRNGWVAQETTPGGTFDVSGDPAEAAPTTARSRIFVKRLGWANNNTTVSDGNELGIQIRDGKFISTMSGESQMGNQTFVYENVKDQMKGYLTIGGATFEVQPDVVDGQLTFGNNGFITTASGDSIRVIGENGEKLYKYFEVALDQGNGVDGFKNIIPFATDTGLNTFTEDMFETVASQAPQPDMITFVKRFPRPNYESITNIRGVATGGGVFAPTLPRTGLGTARPGSTESSPAGNQTPEAPNTPAGQSAVTEELTGTPTTEATESAEPASAAGPVPEPAPATTEETTAAETPEPVAEPNPETTENPETEESPEAEAAANNYRATVENYRNFINNESVMNLLLEDDEGNGGAYTPEDARVYSRIIGELTPQARIFVNYLAARRLSMREDIPFGNRFANFIADNAANAAA